MLDKIVILDFGSQYTQLIARRLRELNVYCEIIPFNKPIDYSQNVKGVILSGSPFSVKQENALFVEIEEIYSRVPVLGICYGAQLIAHTLGGNVEKSDKREYGKAKIIRTKESRLLSDLSDHGQVWMSHADSVLGIGDDFEIVAKTESIPVAAFQSKPDRFANPMYGIQFHPEVTHSLEGSKLLENFAISICGCKPEWTPRSYVTQSVNQLKREVEKEKVIMGLSGGVDSTVAAMLLKKAIGDNLVCIFVNNGLLREKEYDQVLEDYEGMGLNIIGVDATEDFLTELEGVSDPEKKRKIIGRVFIEVFDREAKKLQGFTFLGQGTIYPDVIESVSVHGPSVTIKSHHNVGGLPEKLDLKIVEPLRMLFKDEVRKVGAELDIPNHILQRHPFPGPGLAIRILGELTRDKIKLNQAADAIFIDTLKEEGWYDKVWQAGTILLPVKSVGVMGDERTYEYTIALRAVKSIDGMTAEWSHLPYDLLAKVSSNIINKVKGINRVVYDISTKPPATIEWE